MVRADSAEADLVDCAVVGHSSSFEMSCFELSPLVTNCLPVVISGQRSILRSVAGNQQSWSKAESSPSVERRVPAARLKRVRKKHFSDQKYAGGG